VSESGLTLTHPHTHRQTHTHTTHTPHTHTRAATLQPLAQVGLKRLAKILGLSEISSPVPSLVPLAGGDAHGDFFSFFFTAPSIVTVVVRDASRVCVLCVCVLCALYVGVHVPVI
jgi:hypothetical protein